MYPATSVDNIKATFVSVIIPIYNNTGCLRDCLEMLERQDYDPDAYEVIVVDNGSFQSPYQIVSCFPHARLVAEPRKSSYAARNRGILAANGKILAFTDSDCIPSSDWLKKGVHRLKEIQGCGLLGGRIELFFKNPSRPTLVERFEKLTAFPQKQNVEKSRFSVTANLFTTRNVMEHVGMFDPNLKSGGDVEWGNRVHRNELELIYADNVVISHPARRSLHQIFKKNHRVAQGFDPLAGLGKTSPIGIAIEWMGRVSPPLTGSLKILRAIDVGSMRDRIAMVMILFFTKYFRLIIRLKKVIAGK